MPLLLSPHRLLTDFIILESLHIDKKSGIINFETHPLDNTELRKHFPELIKDARDVLVWFHKDGIHFTKEEIKKTLQTRRVNQSPEEYLQKALLRRIHDLISKLKPFAQQTKWYHKIRTGEAKYKTSPCGFSTYRPQLQFLVNKNDDGLCLQGIIHINGANYNIEEFTRYYFLLESRNEYFLLAYKDFQTLEWLQQNDPALFRNDPQEFAKNILVHLEADYPVDRNNLFTANEINVKPIRRVMLSEISNSFLVLTPQWSYDGFMQEGNFKPSVEIIRDGEVFSIQRNKEEEKQFITFLESLHPNFNRQLNGYFYLSFADAQKKQWFLKVYHKLLELDIEVAGMDMLQHFRYSQHKIRTVSVIKEEKENTLIIELTVCFGEDEVPLPELQKILLAGQRAVLLKDGSLGVLSEDWLQQYGMLIRHGKVDKKQIQVSRWMALTGQSTDDQQILRPVVKQEWWKKWNQWHHTDEQLYDLPAAIQIETLRPYQHKGYEWIRLLAEAGGSACLADDMGLGKTLQTICFIVSTIEKNPASKHLVVCPTSLIYNWQQELRKFAPTVYSIAYHGATRNMDDINKELTQIVVTSYGTLRSDAALISGIHFDTIVIDESHNIKNPAALITQAINQLQSTTRIALSGTPVMNNTFDLYSQLNFLLPGLFVSREFFKREYADPIDRNRDEEKIKALQKLTAPFILRRTKEQVAKDLPEKTESILWCEMGGHQRFAYDSIRENIRGSIFLDIKEKGLNAGKLSILNGILKLRQVCNSCELVKDEDLFAYDSIKTRILIEELINIKGSHKALVFSQFTKMLDLLERDLSKSNIPYCRLDGSTPSEERQRLVNDFESAESKETVFLLSLKAGNAGLNLTSADYVFLFDPWWNRAVEQQAIDRTHRIGQTKNVFAYKMVCRNTIEEKIITLQNRKNKISQELIGGDEEGFIKALTEEDIEYLFS